MHLAVQSTSPALHASIHLIMAACAELWAGSTPLEVVVAAVVDVVEEAADARAAQAPMRIAEKRILGD